jgi:hypothetical protein
LRKLDSTRAGPGLWRKVSFLVLASDSDVAASDMRDADGYRDDVAKGISQSLVDTDVLEVGLELFR